jgi:allene oxide cyclase
MKCGVRTVTATLMAFAAMPCLASHQLRVVEHAVSDAVLNLGKQADSVGDLLTFANPVFDAADKVQVGTDQGYCVRVIVGKSWECFWTLSLKNGQITVEGPFADTGDSLMVITGGTGQFAGAKGAMKLHPRDAKGSAYDFAYDLL